MSAPELAGVGDIRLVRTFRITPDGELYAVMFPVPWVDGWNNAVCVEKYQHAAPAKGCRCGIYLTSHPTYSLAVPTSKDVLAVCAANGVMEVGSRGARVARARVDAIWLSRRISDSVVAKLQARHPSTLVYRSRRAMAADWPLAQLRDFRRPIIGERGRLTFRWLTRLYVLLAVFAAALPTSLMPASVSASLVRLALIVIGVAVVLTGLVQRAAIITAQGIGAIAWLAAGWLSVPLHLLVWILVLMLFTPLALWWLRLGILFRNVEPTRFSEARARMTALRASPTDEV